MPGRFSGRPQPRSGGSRRAGEPGRAPPDSGRTSWAGPSRWPAQGLQPCCGGAWGDSTKGGDAFRANRARRPGGGFEPAAGVEPVHDVRHQSTDAADGDGQLLAGGLVGHALSEKTQQLTLLWNEPMIVRKLGGAERTGGFPDLREERQQGGDGTPFAQDECAFGRVLRIYRKNGNFAVHEDDTHRQHRMRAHFSAAFVQPGRVTTGGGVVTDAVQINRADAHPALGYPRVECLARGHTLRGEGGFRNESEHFRLNLLRYLFQVHTYGIHTSQVFDAAALAGSAVFLFELRDDVRHRHAAFGEFLLAPKYFPLPSSYQLRERHARLHHDDGTRLLPGGPDQREGSQFVEPRLNDGLAQPGLLDQFVDAPPEAPDHRPIHRFGSFTQTQTGERGPCGHLKRQRFRHSIHPCPAEDTTIPTRCGI